MNLLMFILDDGDSLVPSTKPTMIPARQRAINTMISQIVLFVLYHGLVFISRG